MYLFKYHFVCVCVCFMHTRCARVNVSFIFGSRFRCFVLHVCTHVHLRPHVVTIARWLQMFCLVLLCLPACAHQQRSRSHVHDPCSSTCRWARLETHRHNGPHQVRGPCSRGHGGRVATARVSSPRDWAVATGSHLQQDMNIPQATPQPSAPFKTNLTSTLAIIVHSKQLSSVSVAARSCRPAKQPCRNNCTQQIRNFINSGEASIMSLTRVMDSLANFCTT